MPKYEFNSAFVEDIYCEEEEESRNRNEYDDAELLASLTDYSANAFRNKYGSQDDY